MTTKTPTPVSPKVTASTSAGAIATVAAFLLAQVPFIAGLPGEVQAALLTLIVAAVTFGAGYIKRDPARI